MAEEVRAKRAGAEGPETGRPGASASPLRIMAVFLTGAFVAILNQTLMNVALPHMMNDLGVDAATIQWLITGYMLINGVLVPVSAYLVQTISTRRLFFFTMGVFTAGSLISAFSHSFATLLAGRLVQAVGAGIIMPLMMNVILFIFPPESRGRAMGMMGLVMIFAPAIGPTLSGWIVENYHWRYLFFLSLPFAALSLMLAYFWLGDVLPRRSLRLDQGGALFSVVGFGSLLYALSRAGSVGWSSREVQLMLLIGIVFLFLFVVRELSVEAPLLELRVFRYDVFAVTSVVSALMTMAMFAAMVLLPIYLQNIRGFTPVEAGLLLLPGALLMGLMMPIAGALFDRFGARPLAVVGLLITLFTTWSFTGLTAETTYRHILFLYTVRSLGMSLMMMTVMTEGLNQLPPALNSHGTAVANTVRMVAGSLGTALLVTVMTNRATFHAEAMRAAMNTADPAWQAAYAQAKSALAAFGVTDQAADRVLALLLFGTVQKEAIIRGINDAFVWATAITALALVASFFIRRARRPAVRSVGAPTDRTGTAPAGSSI
ncbi:MAG: Membrane component of multidrug resistance system [Hydrogenibacillus schlegelii]|uniref:Membrane component of multidrug resistance system n=1 Tax=Hydrogenibacillus schlegelii TaxID=1484 RepID=A0A2T5GDV8_HYDSH|nr:DHA2 family efflux MFS transporter permease subunit [Hydrogenibacillus schlegelii]PTQ54359.1 MAG: Membrane component of multidrug resistance system [Hydrogenibacillus schlegelii]